MGEELERRLQQQRFSSPAAEALLSLLVAADHVRARLDALCAEHGLTPGQYNVLRILRGAHPEGQPRCEIIRRMVERAPDVTRLVDRLEQQQLAERCRIKEDRRLSLTRITDRGLALLDTMAPQVAAFEREFGAKLGPRDCRELSRLCGKVYDDGE